MKKVNMFKFKNSNFMGIQISGAPLSPRTKRFLEDHGASVSYTSKGYVKLSGGSFSKKDVDAFLTNKEEEDLAYAAKVPSLEDYIEKRRQGNEGFGDYKKEDKINAAEFANSLPARFVNFSDGGEVPAEIIPIQYRGSLCEGSLRRSFENALSQPKPFIAHPEINNLVKRDFAIGLVEEYVRKRKRGGLFYLFSSAKSLAEKMAACEDIIKALRGEMTLRMVEDKHIDALYYGDDLGMLLAHLKQHHYFILFEKQEVEVKNEFNFNFKPFDFDQAAAENRLNFNFARPTFDLASARQGFGALLGRVPLDDADALTKMGIHRK